MPKVRMYTTPFCKYCKVAKEFFQKNNVTFEEVDVTTDQKLLDEMVSKSNQMSVPVFDIGGEILVGFNQAKLEKALKVA